MEQGLSSDTGNGMENPFVVERPVVGEELCGREPILERLQQAARRGEPAALIGGRGAGLTSLARELGRRLAAEGRPTLVVDAAGRESAGALAADGLTALRGAAGPPGPVGAGGREAREADATEDLVERLAAGDGDRSRHLVLDGLGRRGPVEGLDELASAAAEAGSGVTALWQGEEGGTEGLLAPDGASERLAPIPLAAWMPHVLERFLRTDRWIANDHVARAVEATGGRPLHAQLLFHLVWEEAGPEGRVDEADLERAHRRLGVRAGARFRLLLDPLTGNQRRLLEALAGAEGTVHPYASDFVRRHGFASPSSVQRALGALRDAGLVEEADTGPRPSDPVLARWLRRPRAERIEGSGEAG